MNINTIIIAFIISVGILFSAKDNQRNRVTYISLCCLILLFVASFRSPEWFSSQYGLDTENYKSVFESCQSSGLNSFGYTLSRAIASYSGTFGLGFIVLECIIGLFTQSFYVCSFVTNLIFFIPLGIVLYRFSTSIHQLIFAFVFYVALIQVFLLAGARQIIAIGFDLMALLSVIDGKKWGALLFFALGVSIHFSSILFLVPLLLIWFDAKPLTLKVAHLVSFIFFPLVLAFPNSVIRFLGTASGYERYAAYGTGEISGGATTFIFMVEVLSFFCYMAIQRKELHNKPYLRFFYVMAPFFTLLAPLVQGNGTMIRLSLYFHLFLMLLVPFAIDCKFHGATKIIIYYMTIAILAFMALRGGGIEYYFFWQQ